MAKWSNQSRYQGYRGRGNGSTVLKVLIVLLALLLLAGVVFVIYMGEYMEFTEDGTQFRPPWRQEDPEPPVAESKPVVIVDPVITDPAGSETPSLPSESTLEAVRVVEVTTAQLSSGQAAQMVTDAGGNALVVEMKGPQGKLAWQSQSILAVSMGVNAANNATAAAVTALAADGELYLIARIQCFRDQALAKSQGALMTQGGNIWFDPQGVNWSSPANQQAADYLTALCLELAAMGFDEIVLDSSGYPDSGEVGVLAWNDDRPEDLNAPVAAFYAKLAGALADTGVRLSVQTTENALRGDDTNSGVTAALLVRNASRVWLPAPQQADTDYADLLTTAGMEDANAHLVIQSDTGWATPAEEPDPEPTSLGAVSPEPSQE